MIEKLIRCTKCNQVIPVGKIFGSVENSQPLPGVEWSNEDRQAQREFFLIHQDHLLEELSVDHDTYTSNKPSYEPTKVSFFYASNGEKKFLIKRVKEGLGRPAVYDLIPTGIQGFSLVKESDLVLSG